MTKFLLVSGTFFAHFSTFFIACIPFIEGKGAMPIGMGLGLSPFASFLCAYCGSMLPVPFLLTLIQPLLEYLDTNKRFQKLSKKMRDYLVKKGAKAAEKAAEKAHMDKHIKVFTLFLFVATPIPGTGVWSGSLMSAAMGLKPLFSFFIIALANFFTILLICLATVGFFS